MGTRKFNDRKVVFASIIGQDLTGLCNDCLTPDSKAKLVVTANSYGKAIDEMQAASLATIKPKAVHKKKREDGWEICISLIQRAVFAAN